MPTISNIAAAGSVGRYEPIEITFDLDTVAARPCWPYDADPPDGLEAEAGVTVDCLLLPPHETDWDNAIVQPAFYTQDYSREHWDTNPITGSLWAAESVVPSGAVHWCARFAPTTTGTWQYKLRATDSAGTVTSDAGTFNCVASTSHGFVRVAEQDKRYFELGDGTPLVGPAMHYAHATNTYVADEEFAAFAAVGIRISRYFLSAWGYQHPFGGTDVNHHGYPQFVDAGDARHTLSLEGGPNTGDLFCAQLAAGCWMGQDIYLKAGLTYRFSAQIRLASVTGTGARISITAGDDMVVQETLVVGNGTAAWTEHHIDFTPTVSQLYRVVIRHDGTGGTVYADYLSLVAQNGESWSGEYLSKGRWNAHQYVDLKEAWKVDRILDAAQANGLYLQLCVGDKLDDILGGILADGTAGAAHQGNFFGSTGSPIRWLWQAWWRYAVARWSAYTCILAYEPASEVSWTWPDGGVPADNPVYQFLELFADTIHAYTANPHLAAGTFETNIPMDFWKDSGLDYLTLHEYFGQNGSNQQRCYAWGDYVTPAPEGSDIIHEDEWSKVSFEARGEGRCLRIDARPGCGYSPNPVTWHHVPNIFGVYPGYTGYGIGIIPGRTYTVRFDYKGQNINTTGDMVKPGLWFNFAEGLPMHDGLDVRAIWIDQALCDGTWRSYEGAMPLLTGEQGAKANMVCVCPVCPANDMDETASFWIDNLEIIDDETGEDLMVDGGFDEDRIDHDTALAMIKYGKLLWSHSNRLDKPAFMCETGIYGATKTEWSVLAQDTKGVHLRKMLWAAAVAPYTPYWQYYFRTNLDNNDCWDVFSQVAAFMADIPVNNGHYRDAEAEVNTRGIRVVGQKDTVNGRAHLWADRVGHNWKAVVDGNEPMEESATVTLRGFDPLTNYRVRFFATDGPASSENAEALALHLRCQGWDAEVADSSVLVSVDSGLVALVEQLRNEEGPGRHWNASLSVTEFGAGVVVECAWETGEDPEAKAAQDYYLREDAGRGFSREERDTWEPTPGSPCPIYRYWFEPLHSQNPDPLDPEAGLKLAPDWDGLLEELGWTVATTATGVSATRTSESEIGGETLSMLRYQAETAAGLSITRKHLSDDQLTLTLYWDNTSSGLLAVLAAAAGQPVDSSDISADFSTYHLWFRTPVLSPSGAWSGADGVLTFNVSRLATDIAVKIDRERTLETEYWLSNFREELLATLVAAGYVASTSATGVQVVFGPQPGDPAITDDEIALLRAGVEARAGRTASRIEPNADNSVVTIYFDNVPGGSQMPNPAPSQLTLHPVLAVGVDLHPVHPAWTDIDNLLGVADDVGASCDNGLGDQGGAVDCLFDCSLLPSDAIITALDVRLRWLGDPDGFVCQLGYTPVAGPPVQGLQLALGAALRWSEPVTGQYSLCDFYEWLDAPRPGADALWGVGPVSRADLVAQRPRVRVGFGLFEDYGIVTVDTVQLVVSYLSVVPNPQYLGRQSHTSHGMSIGGSSR